MANVTKDLLRGGSDPSVVKTYATKGFNNEGVIGSTPADRMTENGAKGVTPDVMKMPSPPVTKIAKAIVKVRPTGMGTD